MKRVVVLLMVLCVGVGMHLALPPAQAQRRLGVGTDREGIPTPPDLDYSRTLASEDGLYELTIAPGLDPVRIGPIHTWRLTVRTASGAPVEEAEIRVDGGMPQHAHGLPTRPRVTTYLGDGAYLVEGMKFSMGGWWEVQFLVEANGREDLVTFNLML